MLLTVSCAQYLTDHGQHRFLTGRSRSEKLVDRRAKVSNKATFAEFFSLVEGDLTSLYGSTFCEKNIKYEMKVHGLVPWNPEYVVIALCVAGSALVVTVRRVSAGSPWSTPTTRGTTWNRQGSCPSTTRERCGRLCAPLGARLRTRRRLCAPVALPRLAACVA